MVKIEGAFALELLLDREWEEYRIAAGIKNPWAETQRVMANFLSTAEEGEENIEFPGIGKFRIPCTTYEIECVEAMKRSLPSDEERIAYWRQEYLWKGERILPQVSWDEFLRWVAVREGIEESDFRPCEAKDGQCAFTCKYFGEECSES